MKYVAERHAGMSQQGFTLIELLVTMVIAMIILGGLLFSFMQQNSEYNYQNKRVDAYQDMEFGINFMLNDVRNSLRSQGADAAANIAIVNRVGANPSTAGVSFKVWDPAPDPANINRLRHCYLYQNGQIYFRRDHGTAACNVGASRANFNPILGDGSTSGNVTFFRVFLDSPGVLPSLGTVVPSGAPLGLPFMTGRDSQGTVVTNIPGYTILIEIAVDAGYKNGSFLDVKGVDVRTTADKRKRIWRYVQGYPGTVVQ